MPRLTKATKRFLYFDDGSKVSLVGSGLWAKRAETKERVYLLMDEGGDVIIEAERGDEEDLFRGLFIPGLDWDEEDQAWEDLEATRYSHARDARDRKHLGYGFRWNDEDDPEDDD